MMEVRKKCGTDGRQETSESIIRKEKEEGESERREKEAMKNKEQRGQSNSRDTSMKK